MGCAVGDVLQPLGFVHLGSGMLPLAAREFGALRGLRAAPRGRALAAAWVLGGRRLGLVGLGVVVLGAGAFGIWDLERKTGPVALYGRPRPPGGPSASALGGSAREMAMEVACREAKEPGIGAMRGRDARLAGLVLADLVKGQVFTVVATVVASATERLIDAGDGAGGRAHRRGVGVETVRRHWGGARRWRSEQPRWRGSRRR